MGTNLSSSECDQLTDGTADVALPPSPAARLTSEVQFEEDDFVMVIK